MTRQDDIPTVGTSDSAYRNLMSSHIGDNTISRVKRLLWQCGFSKANGPLERGESIEIRHHSASAGSFYSEWWVK